MVNGRIKWADGLIQRYAGTGVPGYGGDGGKAENAQLNGPAGLAVDGPGNVYVAEIFNNAIRKIDAKTGLISTIAGCGQKGFAGDGGPAVKAMLNGPEGVFVDMNGNIFIADTYNQRIRKVDGTTGIISTIAGNGEEGYNGDGMPACNAKLNSPSGIVVDSRGNAYFNDYKNERIRKVSAEGIISTYAGTGVHGYTGDGGPASRARINDVYGLGIDRLDNLYLMDSLNFAVRKVDSSTGIISTIVGRGEPGPITEFESIDKSYIGGIAHEKGTIGLEAPHAVEIDNEGNMFVGDTGACRIRVVNFGLKSVYTVAGTGENGFSGDGGRALDARINVHGLRMDSNGNIYFVDFHNHVVRVVRFETIHPGKPVGNQSAT